MIKDKNILITGGTGSLGTALVDRWHKSNNLTILSRNPHKQINLAQRFGLNSDQFVLADICDYEAVRRACIGQDILIHTAALKVISQGEAHPKEYLRVNAFGTQTVIQAWQNVTLSKLVLYINSDKGVSPLNLYGMTKGCGEKMAIKAGFSSLRYGNVVESEGAFIRKWKEQIAKGQKITLRQPEPTRFFVSMELAIDLIENALMLMEQGTSGIFVPHGLKSFSVYEVARALYPLSKRLEDFAVFEPLQPGEKQHEILNSEGEILSTGVYSSLLSLVHPGYTDWSPITSALVSLSGEAVLKALDISPIQEVFS